MSVVLRLLDEVSFGGEPIAGARSADLLAALVAHRGGLPDARLREEVWSAQAPSPKALQVQVSRIRAQCGPDVVVRYDGGYRLGLGVAAVDVWWAESLVEAARTTVTDDPQQSVKAAAAAEVLLGATAVADGEGPLAEVRRRAISQLRDLDRIHGLALARCGRDVDALSRLHRAHSADRDDVEVLEALLRAEAATAGAAVALARYDAYRRDLADRLGIDPDQGLQRVHRELLVGDDPVRVGVRYDVDELLGRAADLAGLRTLVRTGRLTTILGPGGLGKTRVAHVLAREASQPRVHFVELVGISSPDDVVSEVGAALGVRNSVTARRALSPAQQADVRSRISQELDTVPTLLVLDNCEHVLEAVASLVAFLLVTTRDLRVVTTSRAPLAIAAERVFPLSQLAAADAAQLFTRRARAVRPDAVLPDEVVGEIVERLDGLPLAVELAAARVRTMSADEVRRALGDRFALLRGRDRSAPARHQTLGAVIRWSWDLLAADEQRALAWLSVFHDGFSVQAATALLGPTGPRLVDALVDQSLLSLSETGGTTRYRMLETVREFGAQRLVESGEVNACRGAQAQWAVALAEAARPEVFGTRQVDTMDLLSREEGNLTEILRRLLVAGDAAHAVPVLAAVGALWAITGNHPRFFALADLSEQLLQAWDPPPELVQVTLEAVGLLLVHIGFLRPDGVDDLARMMASLGEPTQPWTRVIKAVFAPTVDTGDRTAAALTLTEDPDRETALIAWQWAAVLAENQGEVDGARAYVEKALDLVDDETTVWQVATLHAQVAMLDFNAGLHDDAARHARVAVPLLERLHADEDALSMRTSLALAAIHEGDLDGAERMLAEAGEPAAKDVTGGMIKHEVRAELLRARGDIEGALASYRDAIREMRESRFLGIEPTGTEPWTVVALGAALTGHVEHGVTPQQRDHADELAVETARVVTTLMSGPEGAVDYPVTGMALAGLAAWVCTRRDDADAREAGVRLLAVARSFAYNRWFPVMAFEPLAAYAEAAAPGRLAAALAEYGDRRGRDLRSEVLALLGRARLTSSG